MSHQDLVSLKLRVTAKWTSLRRLAPADVAPRAARALRCAQRRAIKRAKRARRRHGAARVVEVVHVVLARLWWAAAKYNKHTLSS